MPKLCQKCHKNPAVVHFRAYDRDGHHSTVSYCLPCAAKMAADEEAPAELRQMLQGMMRDLREDFPEELERLQEQEGLDLDDISLDELFSQGAAHHGKKESSPKTSCSFCHRDLEGKLPGEDDTPMKCGHCLTTVREAFHARHAFRLRDIHAHSAESQGLPCFFKGHPRKVAENKVPVESESERLVSLLRRYHRAVSAGKTDGAELLKEELNCLRRNLTEEMRRHATPAPYDDVADFLALPSLNNVEIRDAFWRLGWLPFDGGNEPQIRLSSGVVFYRTIVDWPMSKDATAADYHRQLAQFLWRDPIFAGGQWIPKDNSLSTKNHRLLIDCGSGAYCQRRSFYFEGQMYGKPGEGGVLLKHLRAFLRRLEHRCTFFTDPEFGYYSPRRDAMGSCIYPMEYLHLPALCMTMGIQKLQKIVQSQDFSGCLDRIPGLYLTSAEGIPKSGLAQGNEPIGLLVLVDSRTSGTPLRERILNLNRVAKFLEKEEIRARQRIKANIFLHRSSEDIFARSLALLRNARMISQEEAAFAISRVWLGVELGCLAGISKRLLFRVARYALMLDNDFEKSLLARRYERVAIPEIQPIDYSTPSLEDLDQLGDVLWEDQDSDIVVKKRPFSRNESAEPFGVGDILGNLFDNPVRMLEKLRDAFEGHQQEGPDMVIERARRNDLRASMIRDLMTKKTDLGWEKM